MEVKVNVSLFKHYAMKTRGEWRYSSTILNIYTRWI
jgi:hypothetical protein